MTKITETFNTRYNLRRATRARALSLPHSPRSPPGAEALNNTPLSKLTSIGSHYATAVEKPAIDVVRKYNNVVRANATSVSLVPEAQPSTNFPVRGLAHRCSIPEPSTLQRP